MPNLVRASSDAETDYTTFRMVEWQSQWTKHPDFFWGLIWNTMGVQHQYTEEEYSGLFIRGIKWSKCSLRIVLMRLGMLERSRSVSKRLTQMGVVTGCDNGFPSPVSLLTSRLWVFLSRLIVDDEVSNLLKMKRACCKIGVDSHSQSASAFHFRHTTTFIRKVQ